MNGDEVKQWLMERLPSVIVNYELHITNDEELIDLLQLDTSIVHVCCVTMYPDVPVVASRV